ncbi:MULTISPECIES: BCCT family transporter [unclassified Gordonia (in: high G+C Gram-positive bacteria)]|uniref:BCCT family transporter n=1 Tax=unclassified Gordonia (in: high G+C Gram-positive bacteria) TaxID=2657482 RepID=UPI00071DA65C|nr:MULTISPECIES: BCCT family transporter [unclassified Gordonia (in: high G+C Gram-positive bacteria)]KSU61154.1 transporter [Gordonia sp. SGD-V-85]SCB73767.1 choline/glycine/proline betaine transport protein [Gordonia sp. v-85]
MFRNAWRELHKPVFLTASALIFGLIMFAVIYAGTAADAFENLNKWITDGVGWWYVLIATGFVLFAVYCAISRIGTIKLGEDDEDPEFGVLSWFAMLFAAGMGIGLVFYGVAEPLSHYVNPPEAGGIPGGTDAAANQAMELTLYHWGLHAWAIYVVVGLGLAYMTFRKGRPLSVRWLLEPLLGRERVEGWLGHAVDIVAIVGTLFGVATSLGFGIQQISAGLDYLGWVDVNNWIIVALIIGITGLAIFSVVTGVTKGLRWLSNLNMAVAAALTVFVLLLGSTLFLIQSWVQNIGNYIQAFPDLMLRTAPFTDDGWEGAWTIFYWGWWISWAPFVGMFIARISRGRTIRQFIGGVLIMPTLVSTIWFTVFGDSGILRQMEFGDMLVDGEVDTNTSLFQLLDTLPMSAISSVVAIVIVVLFFVTSSDSGSLVIDMLATGGKIDTPKLTRVYWASLQGVAAAVLLLVGGTSSLTALQTMSIATAVPFSIVMVLACISLLRAFHYDVAVRPRYVQLSTTEPVEGSADTADTADMSAAQHHRHRRARQPVSATFAGLPGEGAVRNRDGSPMVLAVREVPHHAVTVNPETGSFAVSEGHEPENPLGDDPTEKS